MKLAAVPPLLRPPLVFRRSSPGSGNLSVVAIAILVSIVVFVSEADSSSRFVPTGPLNLTIRKITSNEIHLTWAKPSGSTESAHPTSREAASKHNLISAQSADVLTDSDGSLMGVLKDASSSDYVARLAKVERSRESYVEPLEIRENKKWPDAQRISRRKKRRRDTETAAAKAENANDTSPLPFDRLENPVSDNPTETEEYAISYVLYYEKGNTGNMNNMWEGDSIDKLSEDASKVKDVLLTHVGKDGLKGVKYTLKNLDSYTYYRIWVCAYFVSPSDIHSLPPKHSLGPRSTRVVCLTDIPPPPAPILRNLTCDQPPGTLFLQWTRPEKFVRNITSYTIKFKQLDISSNPFEIQVDGIEGHIEAAINFRLEIRNNMSTYEVTLLASSKSIVEKDLIINGTETKPYQVVMTPDCVATIPVMESLTTSMLISICAIFIFIVLVLLVLFAIYHRGCATVFKKCYPMSYLFLEEGVPIGGDGCGESAAVGKVESQANCPKKTASPAYTHITAYWAATENKTNADSIVEYLWDPRHPPVLAEKFFAHTAALHADGDIGFSKEYELIQSKSSMLSHTSHHSQHPDNRHKNRYLNITAYDHSRVCLLPSSSCLCESDKEHRKSCTSKPSAQASDSPSHCDYVNANFIDGIVAEIDSELAKFIVDENNKRKMTAQKKKQEESINAQPANSTSELWISVDESQRPFNYIPLSNKSGITENLDANSSFTSETKNLLNDRSLHESFINTNTLKGKLSLDLDKKDDKKVLTPSSDILANTCRLSINLDRKDEKHDEIKTEKNIKELKSKKRSTSADTKDIIMDKKALVEAIAKIHQLFVTANDSSPSNNPPKIEGAFLNIEFSGIVDSERELQKAKEAEKEANKLAKESEETLENLDDLYVQIEGESYRVNSSWLLDRRRYIGTQGPTPGTLPAFWRMVWDHNVIVIVMITNLIERGRRKCDMYWPKEGSETYGIIQVNILKEDIMATYTVRTFQIKNTKIGLSRSVLQYHYTVWPDHGTPEHPLAVLRFREAARKAVPPQAGVILVHCSAGVGRTGTYIVLDAMLNHLRLTGSLNVFGFLCHVRSQRNYLVQTEEQYVFIHDALLEAIQSGDTEVPNENVKEYLKKLLEPFPADYVNTFLSNIKCGPYGGLLLDKTNENQNVDSMTPLIKRNNSEECDFALWSNINDTQCGNDKSLEECRNDIVSVALQEAKLKLDSKVSTNNSNISCNGDSHDDSVHLFNGNASIDNTENLRNSLKKLNNLDEVVSGKTDEISPELILDDVKEEQSICNKNFIKKDLIHDKIETGSVNSANLVKSDNSTSYEKLNGLCAKVSEESKASSVSNEDADNISNGYVNKTTDINQGTPFSAENSNTVTSSISSDTNNHDNCFKEKKNFSPGQFVQNADSMEIYRKDKNYRNRNDDNYELLGSSGRPGGLGGASIDCFAGAHRFACQKKDTSGKKPKNLLEHQFKLITSFEPSKFHMVSACKQVNLSKNRRGCVLPIESGRVHLIPKPGVEGSDYINATWLQGHRSLREYVVTQHPLPGTISDLYRMLWDHSCQILVVLSNCSYDPDCKSFWPTEKNPEITAYNYNIRFLSEEKFVSKKGSLSELNIKKNSHLSDDNSSQESPLQSPSSISSNKGFVLKLSKGSQRVSPVSSTSTDQRKSSQYSPKENFETNEANSCKNISDISENSFYKRQSSNDNQDEERLIPKLEEVPSLDGTEELDEFKKLNNETKPEGYAFDKSELQIETMLNNDINPGKLSPQKQISNGDALSPNDDVSKKSQPKSPSKISLKSLKINSPILKSPTKFKFDFGGKTSTASNPKNDDSQGRKSPQNITETLGFNPKFVTVPLVNMSQLHENSEELGLDCVITTTNISINSIQDDYELKVKLIECPRWLADLDYDENSDTDEESEDEDYTVDEKALDYVIDQRLKAYKGVFGLLEYVSRCQEEIKNSPVVVVDKMGGARAVAFCTLSSVLRSVSKDVYSLAKLHHGRRAGAWRRASDIRALYEALAAYEHPPSTGVPTQS